MSKDVPIADISNRTFVSSVLFLDIVEYSKRSVTEQMTLKQRFNAFLVKALENVATSERIILDTGDGAAVSFQGNPEDALFAGMSLRDAIAAEPTTETPPLLVRFGINLGPIRLIKDINGQLNIIGDGVNVAQRVMSFSNPGEILVSRSYYEVVSRLSDDYIRIFHEAGTRTDKHVREHEVYAIGDTLLQPHVGAEATVEKVPTEKVSAETKAAERAAASSETESKPSWWKRKPVIFGAPIAVLAIVIAAWPRSGPPPIEPPAADEKPAITADADKAKSSSTKSTKSSPDKKSGTKDTATAKTPAAKTASTKTSNGKVTVLVSAQPESEVIVDGSSHGMSPPLKSLSLSPGKHMIELRSAGFASYSKELELKAGEEAEVSHKFMKNIPLRLR